MKPFALARLVLTTGLVFLCSPSGSKTNLYIYWKLRFYFKLHYSLTATQQLPGTMPKIPEESRQIIQTLYIMKNWYISKLFIAGVMIIGIAITSCDKDDDTPSSPAFSAHATVEGKSIAEWTAAWWQHVLQSNCTSNPIFDLTGANTSVNQTGPVFFLFGTGGGTANRTANIPSGKPILFPLVNSYWQNPCSTPLGDNPAQGQSMEEFLAAVCALAMDHPENLSCTLDGKALTDLEKHREISDLFYYTGNIDLASCLDGCINGESQPAVSDGYWIMLKPLSPGSHTLEFTGGFPNFLVGVNYTLTVQ